MRLLIVTDSYPPLIGGATRASAQLANGMAELGHQVFVATSWQRDLPAHEMAGNVSIHRIRSLASRFPGATTAGQRYTPPPFPDPGLALGLRRIIRHSRPDVIHTYGWLTYSLLPALGRRHAPLIVSARDYGNVCAKRTLVRHDAICEGPAIGKCLACAPEQYGTAKGTLATMAILGGRGPLRRRMTHLHSCSHYVQGVMERHLLRTAGGSHAQQSVIPDFRDPPTDGPPSRLPEDVPNEPFILFVGALRRIKGIDVLLDAYRQLREPRPPLVLVGGVSPDDQPVEGPGVTILHDLPNEAVLGMWDRSMFGVAPSVLPEPLGNVVHEAMSRGKPVIGTFPGGHGEMIRDRESGLLVPAGDAPALAAAMQELIDDPDLREHLGDAARADAMQFSREVVFPKFVGLYEQAAIEGGSGVLAKS